MYISVFCFTGFFLLFLTGCFQNSQTDISSSEKENTSHLNQETYKIGEKNGENKNNFSVQQNLLPSQKQGKELSEPDETFLGVWNVVQVLPKEKQDMYAQKHFITGHETLSFGEQECDLGVLEEQVYTKKEFIKKYTDFPVNQENIHFPIRVLYTQCDFKFGQKLLYVGEHTLWLNPNSSTFIKLRKKNISEISEKFREFSGVSSEEENGIFGSDFSGEWVISGYFPDRFTPHWSKEDLEDQKGKKIIFLPRMVLFDGYECPIKKISQKRENKKTAFPEITPKSLKNMFQDFEKVLVTRTDCNDIPGFEKLIHKNEHEIFVQMDDVFFYITKISE